MAAELSGSNEDHSPIAAINVTPFVDVVLVLLVIFMLTAPALVKDVMDIQLPKAESTSSKATSTLGVAVTRQGQVLLNGNLISFEALSTAVIEALKTDPQAQAIISADTEARHGDVVKVIDQIKKSGMNRFAIQIERQ